MPCRLNEVLVMLCACYPWDASKNQWQYQYYHCYQCYCFINVINIIDIINVINVNVNINMERRSNEVTVMFCACSIPEPLPTGAPLISKQETRSAGGVSSTSLHQRHLMHTIHCFAPFAQHTHFAPHKQLDGVQIYTPSRFTYFAQIATYAHQQFALFCRLDYYFAHWHSTTLL